MPNKKVNPLDSRPEARASGSNFNTIKEHRKGPVRDQSKSVNRSLRKRCRRTRAVPYHACLMNDFCAVAMPEL